MLNAFGRVFRKIRIDHGILVKDVADALDVKPSFISAIEHDRKSIPEGFVSDVCEKFTFSEEERRRLCAAEVQVKKKLSLKGYDNWRTDAREAAELLNSEFEHLSEDRMKIILTVLRSEDDEPTADILSRAQALINK